MSIQAIITSNAPSPVGPYSQAKRIGNLVFVAGQVALNPQTPGKPVAGGIGEQTEQTLHNMAAILQAAGTDLRHVVKTTVFLADIAEFASMNEVYARFFNQAPPARSTVQVTLPPGVRVEIEAIAVVD